MKNKNIKINLQFFLQLDLNNVFDKKNNLICKYTSRLVSTI